MTTPNLTQQCQAIADRWNEVSSYPDLTEAELRERIEVANEIISKLVTLIGSLESEQTNQD